MKKHSPVEKGDLVEVQNLDHVPHGKKCILKTDTQDLEQLKRLAEKKPEYIDIDSSVPAETLKALQQQFPEQKIILSYHDFEKTPEDLGALYETLKTKAATLYKIATFANNSVDTVRMLEFVYRSDKKVIGIPMGPFGSSGRVLGPIVGNPITYAPVTEEDATAPGQIPMGILLNKFHFEKLSKKTGIFGLIGDPVETSLGERVHNPVMEKLELDGVYVNFKVTKEDIYPFLKYAMRLPFKGLSVTMPLKEMFGHEPVNTLIFKPGRLVIENTDGEAALKVLGDVHKKHVVVIGIGGSARAIIQTLEKAGASITVLNRTVEKAKKIYPSARPLTDVPEKYDILINCTPALLPIDPEALLPDALIVDIKTTSHLPLLDEAKKRGCRTLSGHSMFLEQAIGQFLYWFPNNLSPKKLRHKLTEGLAPYVG